MTSIKWVDYILYIFTIIKFKWVVVKLLSSSFMDWSLRTKILLFKQISTNIHQPGKVREMNESQDVSTVLIQFAKDILQTCWRIVHRDRTIT